MILTPLWLESVARNRQTADERRARRRNQLSLLLALLALTAWLFALCLI